MPIKSQLHVDQLLSNISVKYTNSEYIAKKIFPEVAVKHESDLYRVYDRNFRVPATTRADGGLSREHNFDVSTASYKLEWHALKGYVTDNQAKNYDIADLRADMTVELTDTIERRLEKSVSDLFTKTSWSLNVSLAAANAWNQDTTVSNPIPVFDTGCATVLQNSGQKCNYVIMGHDGYIAFKNHVSVIDRIKYTSAEISQNLIKGLLDVPEVLVSVAQVDTALPGAASSISQLWGDVAFIGYKPAKPGPLQASAGYIFTENRPLVKRWRDEEREAEVIEVNKRYAAKVVSSLSGYLIKDVV